jgi:opacity protein-like surface antigen
MDPPRGETMKLQTIAALASLALTAPAHAADLFGAAPPATIPASEAPTAIEIGSNWYLRGEVGASFEDGPTASISPALAATAGAPAVPLAVATWGGGSRTNAAAGLGFGYRFSDYLRLDATWDYSTGPGVNRSTSFACTPIGIDAPGVCSGAMNLRQHANTFLANAYVDLGNWSGLTPYLGGGIGLGVNTTQMNVNYSESASGLGLPAETWTGAINSTTYGVAWALMAGLSYQLTPSVAIDLGYRYLNGGPTRTFVDPLTGTALRQRYVSQQVLVGVRYLIQ